jgi:hypothetical protein
MTVYAFGFSSSPSRVPRIGPLIMLLVLIAGGPAKADDPAMPFNIGLNVGSCFVTPILTISPSMSIPIVAAMYLDVGCDFGFMSNAYFINNLSYNSYYPYARISAFIPFNDYSYEKSGFHIGLGYGHMIANYRFGGYDKWATASVFDMAAGFLFIEAIDISYSLRISAKEGFGKGFSHKPSIGFVYSFGK